MSDCPPCPDDDCACDRGAHRLGKCSNAETRHAWGLSSEQQKGSKPQKSKEMAQVAEATPPIEKSGEQRRDEGTAKVLHNTPDGYRIAFEYEVLRLVMAGDSFSSEDVTRVVGMPPNHPNAVGATFRAIINPLLKEGIVEYLTHDKALRPNQNATKIGYYRRKAT